MGKTLHLVWKLHRKIATIALTHYMLGDKLEERVHKAISVTFEEQRPFDPAEVLDFLIAYILYGVCFNGTNDSNYTEINTLVKLENDLIDIVFSGTGVLEDRIPGLQYVWETQRMKSLKKTVDKILKIFSAKYKEHVETFDNENTSRKHLRTKVTPDFHLWGKSGVRIKMIKMDNFQYFSIKSYVVGVY